MKIPEMKCTYTINNIDVASCARLFTDCTQFIIVHLFTVSAGPA